MITKPAPGPSTPSIPSTPAKPSPPRHMGPPICHGCGMVSNVYCHICTQCFCWPCDNHIHQLPRLIRHPRDLLVPPPPAMEKPVPPPFFSTPRFSDLHITEPIPCEIEGCLNPVREDRGTVNNKPYCEFHLREANCRHCPHCNCWGFWAPQHKYCRMQCKQEAEEAEAALYVAQAAAHAAVHGFPPLPIAKPRLPTPM